MIGMMLDWWFGTRLEGEPFEVTEDPQQDQRTYMSTWFCYAKLGAISLSRSLTLFLSLGAWSLQWSYKREGVRWEVQEVQSNSGPNGPREMGDPTCAKYLSVCSVGNIRIVGCSNRLWIDPGGRIVCPLFGESASPFIDEGDGCTRGSMRGVCVLSSLVAHAVGYKAVCRRP